jgi:hypothetical protein
MNRGVRRPLHGGFHIFNSLATYGQLLAAGEPFDEHLGLPLEIPTGLTPEIARPVVEVAFLAGSLLGNTLKRARQQDGWERIGEQPAPALHPPYI